MKSPIESICGCDLNNPDSELFELRVLTPQSTEEESAPSRDYSTCWWSCPAECMRPQDRCLIPKEARLYKLGREESESGVAITYIASEKQGETLFFRLCEPPHCWAAISRVEENEMPDWAISAFRS